MNPLSDDELRDQLERRTAAPLSHTERVELIESIHDQTVGRRQIRREWTVFRWLTAALAVTVVALVVVLAYPRTSPSATAGPIGVPPTSLVRTAQQLADSVAAGNSVGQVVLARGELESDLHLDRCQGRNPCYPRVLADTNPAVQVDLGSYSTGPAGLGVLAFRIQPGYVTYLGQASVDPADEPWTVSNLFAQAATADPTTLFAVRGWLVEAAILSCPMPLDIMSGPDLSYYCQASWLTPDKEYSVTSRTSNSMESRTAFEGSLNVQNGAYQDFAPEPAYGELGAEPREAVYLVAVNGCPKYRMGDCPVWKMIGRLGAPSSGQTQSPTPSPTAETKIWTVPELLALAPPDPNETVYAVEGWLTQTLPAPCMAPPNFTAPQDYWCGGSWVTAEQVSSTDGQSVQLNFPNALHVQWSAYRDFALDPQVGSGGGEPRHGAYLVRPAGCPPNVMGDCPVWEMVGRLDPP